MKAIRRNKRGYTLLEIMIVVTLIIILAAIGLPAFRLAQIKSQTSVCLNNLRQIDGLYDQYYLDRGDEPSNLTVLVDEYLKRVPICPVRGSYTLPSGGGANFSGATCSVGSTVSSDHPHELNASGAP